MKKLFTKYQAKFLIAPFIVLVFFLPNILMSKIPIPADSLLGLYHPWRDNSYQNYNPNKFPVKNPLITDPVLQTLPWKMITIKNLKNLNLPLWNPYSFSGQPLLGNIQSTPFQIINIFYLFINYKTAWAIQIILPPILTSVFMYIFLKNKGLSYIASTFGAIVLPFSGFFTAWLTWGTVITTAMWLPLLLFTIDKLSKKITPFYYLILTFVLFQTFVSGHTQTAIYVLFTTIIYLIFLIIKNKNTKLAVFTFSSIILAIFLAAPQILPSIEFSSLSNRQLDQSYWSGRQDWFLPIKHLIQLIAPDFFGNPTTNNYWGVWNYAEFVSFIGLIPLYFASIAIIKTNKNTIFFLALAIVSLILALENPISKLPYNYLVPIISSLQPSRIIFLFVFSLSALSAYGLDYFIKQKVNKEHIIIAISLIFTILLLISMSIFGSKYFIQDQSFNAMQTALRNLFIPFIYSILIFLIVILKKVGISQKKIIIIVFSLTLIELFRFSYKFTPFINASLIYPPTKITNYLQTQPKPFRVATTDRRIASPNSLTAYNIESVSGYDPLYLKNYATFINSWQNNKAENPSSFNRIVTPETFQNPLTDLLNVKYILTFDEIQNENYQKIFEEGITKLYINKKVIPRVFFPQEILKVENEKILLENLTRKDADFNKTAYSLHLESKNNNLIASAQILSYSDQSLQIKTSTNQSATIVISNINYPGWKAFIDKKEADIKKINYIFQSVNVPDGIHFLELKYQPSSFYNGLYLSALGLFITIIVSLYIWHKKYQ